MYGQLLILWGCRCWDWLFHTKINIVSPFVIYQHDPQSWRTQILYRDMTIWSQLVFITYKHVLWHFFYKFQRINCILGENIAAFESKELYTMHINILQEVLVTCFVDPNSVLSSAVVIWLLWVCLIQSPWYSLL